MPSILEQLLGADPATGQRGQSPLVGLIMGDDPRSQAAAQQGATVGAQAGDAARQYLRDVLSGQYVRKGLEGITGAYQYDPGMSALENARTAARDPASLEQATNIALALGAGPLSKGPIRAYHGSPHDFDKFDLAKIGTGEGAQAYGHGLYFAENPNVAKSYKNDLSGGVSYKGQPFDSSLPIEPQPLSIPIHNIVKILGESDATPEQAIAHVRKMMEDVASRYENSKASSALARQANAHAAENYRRSLAAFDQINPSDFARPGRMYEVNIHADPADFLNWDRPLSEQSNRVVDTIADMAASRRLMMGNATGARAYGDLANPPYQEPPVRGYGVNDPVGVSNSLRDAGIPGIRYLDQGSRGAGEGTSNYVVFNPDIIEIIRKYGIAGLLGGGAAVGASASGNSL